MNFFQRHMTLKGHIVLFLGVFFTALLFCQNAAENGVTGWLVTYFKDSGILTAVGSVWPPISCLTPGCWR